MNPGETVKKFLDRWNKHDVDGIVTLLDAEIVGSNPLLDPHKQRGIEGVREGTTALIRAFPDIKMEIAKTVVQGDTVAVEYVETATLKGPFELSTLSTQPTNRSYKLPVALFFRVNDKGLIVELRSYWDTRKYFQQIGIDPASFLEFGRSIRER